MSQSEHELEKLLAESPAAAQARAASAFDHLAAGSTGIVLFGAGNLGRNTLKQLRALGIEPLAFTDNNARLWDTQVNDVPVLSPAAAARQHGASAAFVITIWGAGQKQGQGDFQRQLADLGCKTVIPAGYLFWKYPDTFLPYFARDLPHKVLEQARNIRAAFSILADPPSREEFVAQLRWRLWLDAEAVSRCEEPQYFPAGLIQLSDHECFIDCGAFDGDTLKVFLALTQSRFERYWAFEPDAGNFAKLTQAMHQLSPEVQTRVRLVEAAVAAASGWVSFDARGSAASTVSAEGDRVRALALDEVLDGECPTYLKFDIEGAELDALRGARETIRRHRPRLAVCAYHEQNHLWQVPLLLQSLAEGHRLYLRPHNREAFDLVCYAVPPD